MLALTSSCLSFPISGVAGVSHPPLESSLVSVPWQARCWVRLRSAGTGTHGAPGTCRTPGMVHETLRWDLHQPVFNSSSVLHLLMTKCPANPGLSLFILGFLMPVQNRALAVGRGPKAQPGRGEGPAPVTVACASSHLSLSVLLH